MPDRFVTLHEKLKHLNELLKGETHVVSQAISDSMHRVVDVYIDMALEAKIIRHSEADEIIRNI